MCAGPEHGLWRSEAENLLGKYWQLQCTLLSISNWAVAFITAIMPKKRTNLVCQHLENISASALEKYQDIIRDYIRERHGIYALYKRDRLYYVGLARNLRGRLKRHLRDRHKGLWDRFSVYLTIEGHHIKELESLVLRIVKPKGNSLVGKLPRSDDMKRRLLRAIKIRQREELQVLIGKRIKVTRIVSRKRLARRKKSETLLGPYLDQPLRLRAIHNGKTFRARVRRNGWIYFNGYLYASPSHVAQDICRRRVNGWTFWRYERGADEWVPLRYLKR